MIKCNSKENVEHDCDNVMERIDRNNNFIWIGLSERWKVLPTLAGIILAVVAMVASVDKLENDLLLKFIFGSVLILTPVILLNYLFAMDSVSNSAIQRIKQTTEEIRCEFAKNYYVRMLELQVKNSQSLSTLGSVYRPEMYASMLLVACLLLLYWVYK